MKPITHNGQVVPWTAPWSNEMQDYSLRKEHYTQGATTICQRTAQGSGTPIYSTVHYQRQRQAIIQGRCDVCGGMIRPGQARVLLHPGDQLKGTHETGHVMAPSHRECAKLAATICPWIIDRIRDGALTVIVAQKTRIALAVLDPEVVEAETGILPKRPVFGHAKLIVDKGRSRDVDWLMRELVA